MADITSEDLQELLDELGIRENQQVATLVDALAWAEQDSDSNDDTD